MAVSRRRVGPNVRVCSGCEGVWARVMVWVKEVWRHDAGRHRNTHHMDKTMQLVSGGCSM